jgi:diguanylate cyclase (GGDEF)-like protein/PAS domain S-box-containing protein
MDGGRNVDRFLVMTERAAIDSRSVIDAAFRRAVVGMAITDAGGYYLEVNDTFCSLLGYTPEELLSLSFRDVTAAGDLPVGASAMRDLAEGRTTEFRFEKRYVTKLGVAVWARTTGIAVHDESGSLLRVIVQVEDVTGRRASEALLSRRDSLDELTDIANRRTFYERIDQALLLPPRRRCELALLVVNLDRFHQINAGLGRACGDAVLCEVARRLTAAVRGHDLVARLAGDQFAVLMSGIHAPLDAVALAIDLRRSVGQPYWADGHSVFVSARIGVVTNVEESDSDTLMQMAEAATQQAKTLAGGWALHTEGANTSSREELGLVSDLRAAIVDGALTVAYQPVVDQRGGVRYVEALARWHHPERGAVPPDQFIALAEHNDLIGDLTTLVLTTAVEQVVRWRAEGIGAAVAVNLSGRLLAEPGLAGHVASILSTAGLAPSALTLEITETALAEGSNPATHATLNALRDTGVRISIDDFGTGYSSLTYLKELPVDELKIDRSFVLGLDTDERSERIVRSIIDLAHSLDLTVVAEGVEDTTIASQLTSLGSDFLQGYAIARPAPAAMMTEWLQQRSASAAAQAKREERRGLTVLMVDSQPASRAALRRGLRDRRHKVAQAHSGAAALRTLKKRMPDVVILDHLMPGLNGIETAPRLRAAGYAGPIVLLSGSAPDGADAARFPLDVWPVSHSDEELLLRLIDGYSLTSTSQPPPQAASPTI